MAASLFGAAMPAGAATPHTLKVVIHGSGTVSSKPAGIACPRKCTAKFAVGTSVRLSAKAKSGSRFLRWSGSCTGSGACKVKMSGQKAVTAQFVQSNESVAVPGPYSGEDSISFDVAPGGRGMLNVDVPSTYLTCTPSGSINDQFEMLQVAIKSNGSFSGRTSQNGVLSGSNVKFTYILAGHFEPATRSTPASAAGTWRENVVFASGTVASCTSNKQSWTAALYREPAKKEIVARPGPYSGAGSISFDVAPGGKSMLNVDVPSTYLYCTPAGSINDQFEMLQVAIKSNGSFSGDGSQNGVLSGSNVKFTYSFAGSFEGTTPAGVSTAAGTWREDVVFASGTTTACTSNNQFWTATLSPEPAQKKIVAKPGAYSGAGITFTVGPGGGSMMNVSVPSTYLYCTPSGSINDQFEMLQVAIKSSGSFSAQTSQSGVLSGVNVKFTYTFAGSFEGPTPAGASTAAGTWREDVVFASGTTTACTSNNQFWTATAT